MIYFYNNYNKNKIKQYNNVKKLYKSYKINIIKLLCKKVKYNKQKKKKMI